MPEREVRYCTTEDGVRIAYWTRGEGPPLVYIPEPVLTASEADNRLQPTRQWYDRLAAGRTLVRFDHRGTGLSEHNGVFSLDAFCLDLAAVVDALSLGAFHLWGDMDGGIIAAAYTARNPGRVSRLVLWNSWANAADIPQSATLQTLDRLIDVNWPLFSRTATTLDPGWTAKEAQEYAQYVAAGCEAPVAREFINATWEFDIEALLPAISCPVLVLHRRELQFFPPSLGQRLAAGMPDARFTLIDGASLHPWLEHADEILRRVGSFAPAAVAAPSFASTEPAPEMATRTVLFTDIVGHTEMMQRLGDEQGRAVLREHERITRDMLKQHGGAEVKTMGDGFMASFGSVTKAVECAIALQRAFAAREGEPLSIRIGLNAGEPIEEEGDLFGAAVILAARIAAQAQGGEILASLAVRELCAGKGFLFSDTGEVTLKGFEEPVRLFAVRWGG